MYLNLNKISGNLVDAEQIHKTELSKVYIGIGLNLKSTDHYKGIDIDDKMELVGIMNTFFASFHKFENFLLNN